MKMRNSRLRQDSRLRRSFGGQVGGQAKFKIQSSSPGQVMLLSLLILVGMMAAIMAVSAIVIHEMRMVRGTADAAKAIAAADAGMECALFQYLVAGNQCGEVCRSPGTFTMGNNARFIATITCGAATTVRAIGFFGPETHEVRRALEVHLAPVD